MIRINLLPLREKQRAVGRRQQLSVAVLGLAVAFLAMIVPYMVQGRRLAALDREIADVQRELAHYNEQVKEVQHLNRLKAELEAKLRVIDDLNKKRTGPAEMLADLSVSTPQNLWLLEFKEGGNAVTLTGMSLDNETIALFMKQLQASRYFYNVDLVETAQSNPMRSGTQQFIFKRFIVKASVDYSGRQGQPPTDGAAPPKPAPQG
jgi:type IV pilus assembly protein PilN